MLGYRFVQHAAHRAGDRILNARCSYFTEATELVLAIRFGRIDQVPPSYAMKCQHCRKVLSELIEGGVEAEGLPRICGIREIWIKAWMLNHDSLHLYDSASLDDSDCLNDEQLEREMQSSIASEEELNLGRCGLYCCDEKPAK